jgi:hypothetical protein
MRKPPMPQKRSMKWTGLGDEFWILDFEFWILDFE